MDLDTLLHDSFEELTIDESKSRRMIDCLDRELVTAEPKHPEIMTVDEAAEYLRVTPDVIHELMGEIPCFEIGGRVLFRKDAVMDWILKREESFRRQLDQPVSNESLRLCL